MDKQGDEGKQSVEVDRSTPRKNVHARPHRCDDHLEDVVRVGGRSAGDTDLISCTVHRADGGSVAADQLDWHVLSMLAIECGVRAAGNKAGAVSACRGISAVVSSSLLPDVRSKGRARARVSGAKALVPAGAAL